MIIKTITPIAKANKSIRYTLSPVNYLLES